MKGSNFVGNQQTTMRNLMEFPKWLRKYKNKTIIKHNFRTHISIKLTE